MWREEQLTPVAELVRRHLILTGLIELRRRGILQCVWCDYGIIHIRTDQNEPRIMISWNEAEQLIKENRSGRKPVSSEVRSSSTAGCETGRTDKASRVG